MNKLLFLLIACFSVAVCDDCCDKLLNKLNVQENLLKQTMETVNQLSKQLALYDTKLNQILGNQILGNTGGEKTEECLPNDEYIEDCAYVDGESGVYSIRPPGAEVEFEVYCDLSFQNKKWTVIQNRFDGSVDFYRYFKDYRNGFGDLKGEHWLGLEKVYQITKNGDFELYIQMGDFKNNTKYAQYGEFSLCPESDGYRLNIEGFSGDAGDSLTPHRSLRFSTHDRDYDNHEKNCAVMFKGAWWYNKCHVSNLNGLYHHTENSSGFATGLVWNTWQDYYHSLKTTRMMIRKKNPRPESSGPEIDIRFNTTPMGS